MTNSAKDACFDGLRHRILTTDLAPGESLDEATLSDIYGISRTPLREVLQRLAGAGYVEIAKHRGAKVTSMDLKHMRTFFQTAPMIYASASRLAAVARTSDQLESLVKAQGAFKAATRTRSAQASAISNHRFHEIIAEMADNPYISVAMDRLLIDHVRLSQTFYRPASKSDRQLIEKASSQHDQMIIAIRERDSELAVSLTLEHWDLSKSRLERFVRPDPLPFEPVTAGE